MDRLIDSMIANRIIESSDKAIYEYGLRQGMVILINIFATVIIGLMMSMVWQSLLFMTAYIPLRMYSGGYHAQTQRTCFFLSISMVIISLLAMKYLQTSTITILSTGMVAGIIILRFAPMEDENKPLSKYEIKVYGKKAKILYAIELLIVIAMLLLEFQNAALCLAMSLFWVAGLVGISALGLKKSGDPST